MAKCKSLWTERDRMKAGIRIVSDGTPTGTTVYDNEAGKALKGVVAVTIDPILPHKPITATIVVHASLDLRVYSGNLSIENES